MIPEQYMKEVRNLWCVTRANGKSSLVEADSAEKALCSYNQVASLVPELGFAQESIEAVRSVACIVM